MSESLIVKIRILSFSIGSSTSILGGKIFTTFVRSAEKTLSTQLQVLHEADPGRKRPHEKGDAFRAWGDPGLFWMLDHMLPTTDNQRTRVV